MIESICGAHPDFIAVETSRVEREHGISEELLYLDPARLETDILKSDRRFVITSAIRDMMEEDLADSKAAEEKFVLTNRNGVKIVPDDHTGLPDLKDSKSAVLDTELQQEARLRHRNWILACVLLLVYVTLAVTSSQLTNYVFVSDSIDFKAPYLFTLIKMAFRLILFPVYLCVTAGVKIAKKKDVRVGKTIRRCESIFGADGLTLRSVVIKILPAALTMIIHQLTYTYAIANLTTSIATALYALAVAISYILSWLFLNNPLLLVKSIFVGVSLAGVALISYASFSDQGEGGSKNPLFGIISVLVSTLFLSLHQLAFKKAFPKGDLGQVSFALLGVFGCICLIFWPVPIITKIVGEEQYEISKMPYDILIPTWLMSAVSSTVYGYGLVLSSPYFMSVGELLILAANSGMARGTDLVVSLTFLVYIGLDASIRNLTIPLTQILGTILVGIAFIIMILPDHIVSVRLRKPKPPVTLEAGSIIREEGAFEELPKPERKSSTATLNFIQSTVPEAIQITATVLEEEPATPGEPFDPNIDTVYFIDDDENGAKNDSIESQRL